MIQTTMSTKRLFITLLLLAPAFSHAQETTVLHAPNRLYEDIFASISGQYYMLPDLARVVSPKLAAQYGMEGAIVPYPGFRIGAGYEWKKWSFALESGYTHIRGENPLVTDISIVPVLLKAGYSFFPISSYEYFSVTPTAGLGLVFAQADHYIDVIDMLLDNLTHSENTGFMAQFGVRAGWNPVRQLARALEVFAGFSIDLIIEKEGIIPMPQVELGILLRPFQIKFEFKPRPIKEKIIEENPAVELLEEIIEEEYEEEIFIEEVVEEEPEIIEPPEPVRCVWLALFPPNITTASAEGRAMLDEAGAFIAEAITKAAVKEAIMEANEEIDVETEKEAVIEEEIEEIAVEKAEETIVEEPSPEWEYKIIIKGYAAPFVSVAGQRDVSRRRALYCASFLREKYGIPEELITVEWYGAEALPENVDEKAHALRRSVEIIFEGWIQP